MMLKDGEKGFLHFSGLSFPLRVNSPPLLVQQASVNSHIH